VLTQASYVVMFYDVFQIFDHSLCQLSVSKSEKQTTTSEDNRH